ncbi:hypothetical protein AgCh_039452 [Apium graveolens]
MFNEGGSVPGPRASPEAWVNMVNDCSLFPPVKKASKVHAEELEPVARYKYPSMSPREPVTMTSFMMMGCIIMVVVEHLFISLQLSSALVVASLLSLRVSLVPLTAITDATQNELLPLRVIVQVLFLSKLELLRRDRKWPILK